MTLQTSAKSKRCGFTVTELLIVIGILVLLFSILLPTVNRARRAGARAKAAGELQTISVALEAYKADNGDQLPRSTDLVSANPERGSQLLVRALISPADTDGAPGAGYRMRGATQGKVYGPYLQPEKWKFVYLVTPNELQDANGKTIIYVPARPALGKLDLSQNKNFIDDAVTNNVALYDARYVEPVLTRAQFAAGLGDSDDNGHINGSEQAATQGSYILWAAGLDGVFGTKDDVKNFE